AQGKPLPLVRAAPDGSSTTLATLPGFEWLNGVAAARDGTIYGTVDTGVFRLAPSGAVTWITRNVTVRDCSPFPGPEAETGLPYLRGLTVVSDGSLVVAATGCRSVVKLSPSGQATSILQAEAPWSPTAVAAAGDALYVLEYDHSAAERIWPPRVR